MAARSSRKKTTAKKPARKKGAAKKTVAKKTTAKKAAPRKAAAKKAPPKKAAPKKAAAKKSTAKAAPKKPAAKKAAPKKATAKKTTAKKAASKKVTAKKAAPKKQSAAEARAAETRAGPAEVEEPEEIEAPPKPKPRIVGPHAHPDSGLTKAQFRKLHELLLKERAAVVSEIRKSVAGAVEDASPFSESIDQAQHETEQNFRLRLADKQRKLLNEIQAALEKMDEGEYGVCEGTEDPIGFPRLEVRPWARYSVEYKEMKDRRGL